MLKKSGFVFAVILLFFLAVYLVAGMPTLKVNAAPKLATCSGTGCNGTDPNSTGCDASVTNIAQGTFGDAKIILRKSNICSTYWARTENVAVWIRYLNATLKFYYYTASPDLTFGPVYTLQRYSTSGGFYACGAASTAGPLNGLYYSPCVP